MKQKQQYKLITCILPKGNARNMMATLKEQFGINTVNTHKARGVGKSAPLSQRGFGEQTEKEILSVVVTEEQAEEVFEYLYFESGISEPHGGLMYIGKLKSALLLALPEVIETEEVKA